MLSRPCSRASSIGTGGLLHLVAGCARATLLASLLLVSLSGLLFAQQPPRPNVIVLAFDDLRGDHVGCMGYKRPVTPSIDALAARGTLFETALAQSSWSLPSYASLFTSVYPTTHGLLKTDRSLDARFVTLASILKANGYETAAFTGGAHVHHRFGILKGFDTVRDENGIRSFQETVPEALQWLRRPRKAPYFMLVHSYDAHVPWTPPLGLAELYDPGYQGILHQIPVLAEAGMTRYINNNLLVSEDDRMILDGSFPKRTYRSCAAVVDQRIFTALTPLSDKDVNHLIAHYDGAIQYGDIWVGVFLSGLKRLDPTGNTIVVLLGDHGEQLGEVGAWGHGTTLANQSLHVPLIFAGPGIAAGRHVKPVVELMDVAPTLLEFCGLPPYHAHEGKSLAKALRGPSPQAVDEERLAYAALQDSESVRSERWHLIKFLSGRQTLFDLKEDPHELTDVSAKHPDELNRLSGALADWVERTRQPYKAPGVEMDHAQREMFQQMGYW